MEPHYCLLILTALCGLIDTYPHEQSESGLGKGKPADPADRLTLHTSDSIAAAADYADDYQDPGYLNPYKYKFTLGVAPCAADTELLIIVHTSAASVSLYKSHLEADSGSADLD